MSGSHKKNRIKMTRDGAKRYKCKFAACIVYILYWLRLVDPALFLTFKLKEQWTNKLLSEKVRDDDTEQIESNIETEVIEESKEKLKLHEDGTPSPGLVSRGQVVRHIGVSIKVGHVA